MNNSYDTSRPTIPKEIPLNNGLNIPTVGLGTYKSKPKELETAVKDAIDAGYRHFDCAWIYGNESDVGRAIRAKIAEKVVKREEIYVTSKLWNNFHSRKCVVPMLEESLENFQLDYLDLYLIHWPLGFKESSAVQPTDGADSYSDIDYLETWKGMEDCVKKGLTKSIGVSNFNEKQLERLFANCNIKPVVNQVEVHVLNSQKSLISFCKENDVLVVAYCPLGRAAANPYFKSSVLDQKVINIAKKYKKSAAQVNLRYLIEQGISVIPKSVTKSRIVENIDIFDFGLTPEEVEYLDSCNRNNRICASNNLGDHPHYPFK